MKKTGNDLKTVYPAIYRIAAALAVIGLLRAYKSTYFSGQIAGIIIFLCFYIAAEVVLAAGDWLKQRRLFLGAFFLMSLLSFLILMRFGLQWHVPAALAAWGAIRLILKYDKIRPVFTVLLVIASVLSSQRSGLDKLTVICLIFLVMLELAGFCGGNHFIWIPYYLVLSLVLIFMPVKQTPFDWNFVLKVVYTVGDRIDEAFEDIDYFFGSMGRAGSTMSGYSGLGRTGSGLSGGEKTELTVTGDYKQTAYLKGISYELLRNDGWSKRTESILPYNAWFIEYLNLLYKNNITKDEAGEFSSIVKSEIEYRYIKTSDVIHPAATLLLKNDILKEISKDTGSYSFTGTRGKGTDYGVVWLDIDYADPVFTGLLGKDVKTDIVSYERLSGYCSTIYGLDLDNYISKEDYVNYITNKDKEINARELLDTGMATARMKGLAHSITTKAAGDYEKAVRIESYLRQYTYNLKADHSDSPNFVDDFLFDDQQGYCVHFASAMVELLRIAGIRARYCEGYTAGTGKAGKPVEITSSDAHAWVEAWIDGYGWMVFEPTAAKADIRENEWKKSLTKDNPYPAVTPVSPDKAALSEGEITETENEEIREKTRLVIRYVVLAFIILVLYFVIWFALRILLKKVRYKKKNDGDKLMSNVCDIRQLMEKTYSLEWENSTLRDYLALLKGEDEKNAKEVFDEYYRLRFSKYTNEANADAERLKKKSEELKGSVSQEYLKHGREHFRKLRLLF